MNSPALTALMPVVCAWCDKPMAPKPCTPAEAGLVSHSRCVACMGRLQDELRDLTPADFGGYARAVRFVCRVA